MKKQTKQAGIIILGFPLMVVSGICFALADSSSSKLLKEGWTIAGVAAGVPLILADLALSS